MAKTQEPATVATLIKLLVVLGLVAGLSYGISIIIAESKAALGKGKDSLKDKGINISKNGVGIKTNKRAVTLEEAQDKLQAGIMKGWKSSTFNVPWALGGTRLAGSSHDKNKADYDATHGSKISRKAKNI